MNCRGRNVPPLTCTTRVAGKVKVRSEVFLLRNFGGPMMYIFHDITPNEMLRVPISAVWVRICKNELTERKGSRGHDGISPVSSHWKRPSDPYFRRDDSPTVRRSCCCNSPWDNRPFPTPSPLPLPPHRIPNRYESSASPSATNSSKGLGPGRRSDDGDDRDRDRRPTSSVK